MSPAADGAPGAGDNGAGGGADGGGENTFLGSLPDDIRADPSLANFKGVEDLAREHINVQGLIGRKGVIPPPAEGATEADYDRFYKDLGRPDTAEGYNEVFVYPEGTTLTEGETAFQNHMAGAMHKAGLTPAQVKTVFSEGWQSWQADQAAAKEQSGADNERQLNKDMNENWAGEKGKKLGDAKAVASYFGFTPEMLDKIEDTVGSFALLDKLAGLAEHMPEGALPAPAGGGGGSNSVEGAKAEIARIRADAAADENHPYNKRNHPEHKALHQRMDALYAIVNPGMSGSG